MASRPSKKSGNEEGQKVARDAQTKVDTLRQELKISEVDAMSSSPTPMIDEEIVRRLQGELLTMKTDEVKLETGPRRGSNNWSADQLRNSIQTAVGWMWNSGVSSRSGTPRSSG